MIKSGLGCAPKYEESKMKTKLDTYMEVIEPMVRTLPKH